MQRSLRVIRSCFGSVDARPSMDLPAGHMRLRPVGASPDTTPTLVLPAVDPAADAIDDMLLMGRSFPLPAGTEVLVRCRASRYYNRGGYVVDRDGDGYSVLLFGMRRGTDPLHFERSEIARMVAR
ncbi:MAG TPA: hypothetical protein VL551_13680 [Actinospica sp.]|nr:hypothetical protein [Actinospica sp.]